MIIEFCWRNACGWHDLCISGITINGSCIGLVPYARLLSMAVKNEAASSYVDFDFTDAMLGWIAGFRTTPQDTADMVNDVLLKTTDAGLSAGAHACAPYHKRPRWNKPAARCMRTLMHGEAVGCTVKTYGHDARLRHHGRVRLVSIATRTGDRTAASRPHSGRSGRRRIDQ